MADTQNQKATAVVSSPSLPNGEGGIRTRGELSPTQHFQCCTFGHSVTSPTCKPKRGFESSYSARYFSLSGSNFLATAG